MSFDDKEHTLLDEDDSYPTIRHKFASLVSSCDELLVESSLSF